MISIREAALAAMRLIGEGMSLKHAVQLVSGTYQIEPDYLYREISKLEKGK